MKLDKNGRWVKGDEPRGRLAIGPDGKWERQPVIQAIETEYAGVKFRSRLEARWALFFDEVGVRWEYEPEAFRLADGRGYLPDFRLTSSEFVAPFAGPPFGPEPRWAEVKPEGDSFELAKVFAREKAEPILLCDGQPGWNLAVQHPDGTQTGIIFGESLWSAAKKARGHRFWEPGR